MIIVSTLFFNKTGNQSFLETVREYMKKYDLYLITSASKKDPYYYSKKEAIDILGANIKIIRVYQIIPNILRLIKGLVAKKKTRKVTTELVNLSYSRLNLLSFKVSDQFLKYKLSKIAAKVNPNVICAYEIGAVNSVLGYKKISKLDCKYISKYQGTILGFSLDSSIEDLTLKYPIDVNAFKKSSQFDLCCITNDGTNGFEVLRKFNVPSEKISSLPNGLPEFILSNSNNVDVAMEVSGEINLFTISRLIGWKRVYLSVDIMNYLVNFLGNKNFHLNIYGHGDSSEVEFINSRIMEYNLNKYITVHGSFAHGDIVDIYNMNDIMLSLYKYTNVTNPVFEAIFFNKPLISISDRNLDQVVGNHLTDRIKLFNEQDEEQLIKDVSMYLTSNKLKFREMNTLRLSWQDRINQELQIIGE